MNDLNTPPTPSTLEASLSNFVLLTYILFVLGLTVIGVIIAHIKIRQAEDTWLHSHFIWLIRTFWWGLLWVVLGIATLPIGVGLVVLPAACIWLIYRIIRGLWCWAELRPSPLG